MTHKLNDDSAKSLANGLLADRTKSVTACQNIVTDVQFALSVAEVSPNSIEFAVADRNGDDVPDDIRYSWSGVSGDPVTCSLNQSTPEVVVENVHQFVTSVDKSNSSQQTGAISVDRYRSSRCSFFQFSTYFAPVWTW